MKTITKLTFASLTAALFTATALAGDEAQVIDNHHGSVTYLRPAQTTTTVAVYANDRAVGQPAVRANARVGSEALSFRQVSTPHGTVSYFAPAE